MWGWVIGIIAVLIAAYWFVFVRKGNKATLFGSKKGGGGETLSSPGRGDGTVKPREDGPRQE